MPIHRVSDVEQVVESEESGKFYPKVLTGKPALIPELSPQGWMFCKGERDRIISFPTLNQAIDYLIDRTAQTKQEIQKQIMRDL